MAKKLDIAEKLGVHPKVEVSLRLTRDDGGPEERFRRRERLPQFAEQLFRLDEAQLAQTLGNHVPGAAAAAEFDRSASQGGNSTAF